jgi:hypothetical protein
MSAIGSHTIPAHPATSTTAPGLLWLAWPVWVFALVKLGIHLATNGNYGIFIDELYYIACGRHLDWGYVDHPPMIGAVAWLAHSLFGDWLPGLRLLPALAGAATVVLTGALARELGGGIRAQALAALMAALTPLYFFMNTILSMNAFDVVFCTWALLLLTRLLQRGETRTGPWAMLGLVLGFSLLNKISVLFLGFGLAVGLLATQHRRLFRMPAPWVAGSVAFLIFLPHILWQVAYDWPTLEFMRNAATEKNRPLSFLEFFGQVALDAGPLSFLLVVIGWHLLWRRVACRPVAILLVVVAGIMALGSGKPYYLGVFFPTLFAAGAVAFDQGLAAKRRWLLPTYAVAIALLGVIVAPLALPVLPIDTYIRYQEALIGGPMASGEKKSVGPLPQHFADMFGNAELVDDVAKVWQTLTPEEQQRTAIYADAYPQAGAIDFFGPRYGLPRAVSGHNSYWLWGPPAPEPEVLIVVGSEREELEQIFESVELGATFSHPLAMPWRNDFPIFVCRQPREGVTMAQIWPRTKHYE